MAKLLVVDDDPVSRGLVEAILKKEGHEVTACSGVLQAIETLSFVEFDLLVTDIIMPEHDGFEMVQAARNLRPGIRIIVLSAIDERVPSHLTAAAFAKLGIRRVISKPIKPALLASEVLAALVAD
ncbi:response regulator [Azospirillum thermophilum]|uniref:Response regulator n=1 Tax=Azospirillum thermophilum TaxID=2202148 RepID=A0A2S2CTA8_9PROT|nr:response regulator [Azospirillum thermophilum]AWK87708.1 response regulator [Azospirillum thermophilum]